MEYKAWPVAGIHGTVVTSSAVQSQPKGVEQVQTTSGASAAILPNESVISWGLKAGVVTPPAQSQLKGAQQIQAAWRIQDCVLANPDGPERGPFNFLLRFLMSGVVLSSLFQNQSWILRVPFWGVCSRVIFWSVFPRVSSRSVPTLFHVHEWLPGECSQECLLRVSSWSVCSRTISWGVFLDCCFKSVSFEECLFRVSSQNVCSSVISWRGFPIVSFEECLLGVF